MKAKRTILSDDVVRSLSGADLDKLLYEIDNMAVALTEKKTVDQWLNEVNYEPDPDYVPTQFALEYINFMKLCNGYDGSDNLTPVVHFRVLDTFSLPHDRVANLMFRGFGKTTLIQYLFPFIAVMRYFPNLGPLDFAIYVSDSIENGVASFKDSMEALWRRSEFLQRMLPERINGKVVTSFNATKWTLTNMKGETLVVRGYGVKTGIRGVKSKGKRPQLAVIDDVVSDEDAESDVLIQKINNTIDKAITHALDTNKRKILWLGTPFNAKDPLYLAVESGAWNVNLFPVAEYFPCSREEFRGAWPDRFNYDFLLREYVVAASQGKVSSFNQELMLRIMGEADRLVQDCDIHTYEYGSVMNRLSLFNIYITTDFAVSDKQHADLSAISVWAVNAHGQKFWIDGMIAKQTMEKNFNALFDFCRKYHPMGVGIEASGQQKGFIALLREEQNRRNIRFPFARNVASTRRGAPVNTGNSAGVFSMTNKVAAFNMVLPHFKLGNILFPAELMDSHPALIELITELKLISPSGIRARYDDMLDTVSMLGKIEIIESSFFTEQEYSDSFSYAHSRDDSAYEGYIV